MTEEAPEAGRRADAGHEVVKESERVIDSMLAEVGELAAGMGYAGTSTPTSRGGTSGSSSGRDQPSDRQRCHQLLDQALDLGASAKQTVHSLAHGLLGMAQEMRGAPAGVPSGLGAASSATVLVLPSGRPGAATSGELEVENTGLQTIDVQLECVALL